MSIRWTPEETARLREHALLSSLDELMEMFPGRTRIALRSKCNHEGIKPRARAYRPFSMAEVAAVKRMVRTDTVETVARRLGRTADAIYDLGRRNGITFKRSVRHWAEAEYTRLRELAPTRTVDELLPHFPDRSYEAVRAKLIRLHIPYVKSRCWRSRKYSADEKIALGEKVKLAFARKRLDFGAHNLDVAD